MAKVRPQGNSPKQQKKKYVAHKRANEVLTHYIDKKNFIGGFLVAFSLFEDRVRAFDATVTQNGDAVSPTSRRKALAEVIKRLKGKMDQADITKMLALVEERNKLVHSAMYNVDVFAEKHIILVLEVRKAAVNAFNEYKRQKRT